MKLIKIWWDLVEFDGSWRSLTIKLRRMWAGCNQGFDEIACDWLNEYAQGNNEWGHAHAACTTSDRLSKTNNWTNQWGTFGKMRSGLCHWAVTCSKSRQQLVVLGFGSQADMVMCTAAYLKCMHRSPVVHRNACGKAKRLQQVLQRLGSAGKPEPWMRLLSRLSITKYLTQWRKLMLSDVGWDRDQCRYIDRIKHLRW